MYILYSGICIWLSLSGYNAFAQQPALVSVDAVIRQPFTQTVEVVGNLVALQSGVATARIAGTVKTMHVQVGDQVRRDQPLAQLDDAILGLRLALARANHSEDKARLKLAAQESKRLANLRDSAAISRAAADDAAVRLTIAAAMLEGSAANLSLAELDYALAKITAPFAGTVTETLTEVGGYLARGQAVVRLVSDGRLEVAADIPHNLLGGLTPNSAVTILLDNDIQLPAKVRAIIPQENIRTRTRQVRFDMITGTDFDTPTRQNAHQQSVTVLIPAGANREIITVHKDAIMQRGGDKFVFVVADNIVQMRPIRTGQALASRLEVLDGLQTGEMAVVRGNERLQPNQQVQIAPSP